MLTHLIARIFIGLLFLVSGLSKLFNFSDTVDFLNSHWILGFFDVWFLGIVLLVAITLELLGAILLISGLAITGGAVMLLVFTGIATALWHTNIQSYMDFVALLKNLAIMGGLFLFIEHES